MPLLPTTTARRWTAALIHSRPLSIAAARTLRPTLQQPAAQSWRRAGAVYGIGIGAAMQKRSFFWTSKPATLIEIVPEVVSQKIVSEAVVPAVDQTVEAVTSAPAVLGAVPEGTNLAETLAEPVVTTLTSLADLHALGLAKLSLTGLMEGMLGLTYIYSGLPWWATIATATLVLRLALMPIVIYAQKKVGLFMQIRPQIEPLQKDMMRMRAAGDMHGAQLAAMKMQTLMKEKKVSPFSALWGILPAPFFIFFFFAVRSIANANLPGMSHGGLFWFSDLSVMDPYYILATLGSVAMVYSMQAGQAINGTPTAQGQMMMKIMMIMSFVSIPFFGQLPAAVMVYVLASAACTFVQMRLLARPAVRKALGIPAVPAAVQSGLGAASGGMLPVRPVGILESARAVRESR